MSVKIYSIIIFAITIYLSLSVGYIEAQENSSLGVANFVPIAEKVIHDGDIIVSAEKGYKLSTSTYDPEVYGVVTNTPAVSIGMDNHDGTFPVIASGLVFVNVSTINGAIHKGDFITTSVIPGVGMKATENGYVIGRSLDDYVSDDTREIKKINLSLAIQYISKNNTGVKSSLFDIFRLSAMAGQEKPLTVFKYVIASILVIISSVFGFLTFGKAATKGIDALGRNPLAARMIQVGIVMNVFITIAVAACGLLLAFFIIKS